MMSDKNMFAHENSYEKMICVFIYNFM